MTKNPKHILVCTLLNHISTGIFIEVGFGTQMLNDASIPIKPYTVRFAIVL